MPTLRPDTELLRVMTWNVWWRFGPWERRRRAILEVLRRERPDVVGLQEVWAGHGENLAEWLAAELEMHVVFAAVEKPHRWSTRFDAQFEDESFEIGNAVLSRWPVAESAALRLDVPESPDVGSRALFALLDGPAQVPFFTAHLHPALDGSAVRTRQVEALGEFVVQRGTGTGFPPVVAGDFNAFPDSDEMRRLGGYRAEPAAPGLVLIDAWELAGPTAPSVTWDRANPYVASAFPVSARIDHIRVGPPGPGLRGAVRAVRRAGDGPVAGVWPSDHAAVVADLQL